MTISGGAGVQKEPAFDFLHAEPRFRSIILGGEAVRDQEGLVKS